MTTQQYLAFQANIERNWRGLTHISTGACKGCHECGLEPLDCPRCDGEGNDWQHGHEESDCPTCKGDGKIEPNEREIESAGRNEFTWSSCDSCGSSLGGSRHAAHGVFASGPLTGQLCHVDVCEDCLQFLNYGQLDDLTMLEMEKTNE